MAAGRTTETPTDRQSAAAAATAAPVLRLTDPPTRGEQVEECQRLLNADRRLHRLPPIPDDGVFGPQTAAVVAEFQAEHGLESDGVVGKETWRALRAEPHAPSRIHTIEAKALRHVSSGLSEASAQEWARRLGEAMIRHDITTDRRACKFLATVLHESGHFRWTTELWGPTAAQRRYEGRDDLGNSQRGDGFRFRGRGLIQLTGRANYTSAGKGLNADFVRNPDIVATPRYATATAAWWWKEHGCNELADIAGVPGLLKASIRVNGRNKDGLPNGWTDRQRIFADAVEVKDGLVPRRV